MCLLDVLCKLKKKYNLKLVIAHINYGLRAKDSELDEKLVGILAKKYSLPAEIMRSVKCKKADANLEEKLRTIRYDFFEQTRKKYQADAIAVGHNINDQAETVLMRILRGAGLKGLAAIKFRNNSIIRPLLNISRKEILAYIRKNKMPYRIDKTNLGTDFTRNRIRNKLLPELEKSFNPNIQKVLYQMSQSVADDYDFIEKYSAEWLKGSKSLLISEFIKLHPAIQKGVIRQVVEKHNPSLREIESGHVEEILKIVRSTKNKRQIIKFKKLKIQRKGDKLNIEKL